MKAKKSLGQNFLKSKHALRVIVESANIAPTDTVLEIGPGKGALTAGLLEKAGHVIAIEKDDELVPFLQEMFAADIATKKLTLIHGDIMEMTIEEIFAQARNAGASDVTAESYKLVANIPYYITGALIRMFLETARQPRLMVLMLQKEVARRITATDKKESLLSLSVKAYGTPKYIETVKAMFFSPRPNVDSAILLIKDISKAFFKRDTDTKETSGIQPTTHAEETFFKIIKAGFAHKRKLLVRNLESDFSKEKISTTFASCNLSLKARPEDLSLDQWKCVTTQIK